MLKRLVIVFIFCYFFTGVYGQDTSSSKDPIYDAPVDYDELFTELDAFLDSLLAPKTYAILNIGAGTNFFDYSTDQDFDLQTKRQLIFSPSLGYYHKSGFGANVALAVLKEDQGLNPYQLNTSVSYDYLKSMNFVAGVSATHFFTKDSLAFYTSPLKNELYGYFTYRQLWFKPSIAASYGWGSRNSYEERKEKIRSLRLRRSGYTRINTRESVNDFSIMLSIRHDFYWLNVLSKKDFFRVTPQISFTSGTQNFGFNQTADTYGTTRITRKNEISRTENTQLDDRLNFQPLSLSTSIKSELSMGKFFIQPLIFLNYYFPAPDKNISTAFTLNTGLIF